MNGKTIHLLLIEDDKVDQMAFERFAGSKNLPYDYTIAGSVAEAKEILKSINFDVIIADYMLGDGTSFELFDLFKDLPVIVTTGTGNEEVAVEAMKLGAYDYLIKDPEGNYLKTLPSTVELALKRKQTEKELRNYQERLESMVKERTAQLEAEIVERKQAEGKLLLHSNIISKMTEGVFLIRAEDRIIIYTNPAFERMFGYGPDELLGKHVSIVNAPTDKEPEEAAGEIIEIIHKTGSWKGEIPNIKKDGTIFWCFAHVSEFEHPEHGRVWVTVHVDITERILADEALRNSEKKLAQAIQGNSIPTLIIDSNHIITHWNKSCENLTGIPALEMVGTKKHWFAFYDEERPILADFIADEASEEEIAGYFKDSKLNKSGLIEDAYEGESFRPNLGEKGKWLFFTAAPLRDHGGNIIGAIETFQDITERRSTEDQLRQAQKMEAIGTLAGGVAHDFNNLLTTIIGYSEIVLDDLIKDTPLYDNICEILKAGKRAGLLTRQLLAFSRKQVIQPEILNINDILTDTNKMLRRTIGEDIELKAVFESELWNVKMDPGQINQILMNLVVNARDAMPRGGRLTIETANMDLDENYFLDHGLEGAVGSYVMLATSDTGSGMDKETQGQIFDPFFTTKERGKGTGLGLSTVYGIVKQNNGFVWVYSELELGSTFKIYLPKVKADVEEAEKERIAVGEVDGSETVLIVEDDDSLRKLTGTVLKQNGYRVLEAENGEDALRISKEHEGSIELMITDVVMPKMSGKEAAERLQPLYPQMKVIYMSGYTDDAIVHHGVLAPGLNFLEKPFSPEGLGRKVREVLDK